MGENTNHKMQHGLWHKSVGFYTGTALASRKIEDAAVMSDTRAVGMRDRERRYASWKVFRRKPCTHGRVDWTWEIVA